MSPAETLQAVLDAIGHALMTGDREGYVRRVLLPFELKTAGAEIVVRSEEELRRAFDGYRGMLAALRVTDYIRLARAAHVVGPGLIEGAYATNLLSNGYRVVPPFDSVMRIAGADGVWRVARIETEILNDRWPIGLPLPPGARR